MGQPAKLRVAEPQAKTMAARAGAQIRIPPVPARQDPVQPTVSQSIVLRGYRHSRHGDPEGHTVTQTDRPALT